MRTQKEKSLIRKIRSFTSTIIISLLIIFAASILIDRSILINNTKNRIYAENLKQQKEFIKNEIINISDIVYHYIDHNHMQTTF